MFLIVGTLFGFILIPRLVMNKRGGVRQLRFRPVPTIHALILRSFALLPAASKDIVMKFVCLEVLKYKGLY